MFEEATLKADEDRPAHWRCIHSWQSPSQKTESWPFFLPTASSTISQQMGQDTGPVLPGDLVLLSLVSRSPRGSPAFFLADIRLLYPWFKLALEFGVEPERIMNESFEESVKEVCSHICFTWIPTEFL